jgi:2,3-bisphosphoglycerate-dependent phosphoglycerate mutase
VSVQVVYETHSLTIDNEAGRATGWLDGELSERGRQLAAELGARRRSDGIAVVYTSDLGRAVETAAIAFGGSDLPVVHDRRLRECNFGRLNGCARAQLDRYGPTGVDEPYPEGEGWREAITPVIDFLDEVVRSRDGERILLIGHMSAWYALECVSKRERIEQALDRRMTWQPGWEYTLSRPLGTPSETVRA